MTTALTRLAGSAFEITITVPWSDVKVIYDKVFDELCEEIEVEGFRKGKAPKDLVAKKVDKSKVYGEVVNHLVPESYRKALEEHGLKPVMSPKVHLQSAEEEKDWQFLIQAAEKPKVELGEYKKAISDINTTGKIWTPGQVEEKKDDEEKQKQEKLSKIIEKLLEVTKVELSEIITEAETSRLVSQLVEDVRQAGLTFEQYLASSGQDTKTVQEKYRKQAENSLKLEFIFDAIADDLKITVEDAEIEAIINKETDESRKKALKEQSYMIASIMRRDKTIAKLLIL